MQLPVLRFTPFKNLSYDIYTTLFLTVISTDLLYYIVHFTAFKNIDIQFDIKNNRLETVLLPISKTKTVSGATMATFITKLSIIT